MWDDKDLALLQQSLELLPKPFEPLDISAIDGFLVGVLLQPKPVPEAQWWPLLIDPESALETTMLVKPALASLQASVRRRHAWLDAAIEHRQWFDPLVYELEEDDASPSEAMLPWAAGFALALDHFEGLVSMHGDELTNALALIYRHFDPDDLEDADDLLEVIDSIEPASTLEEAVEDTVTATLLLADLSRPLANRSMAPGASRPGGATRPTSGGGRGGAVGGQGRGGAGRGGRRSR